MSESAHALHRTNSAVRDLAIELHADDEPLRLRKGQVINVASDGKSCTIELGKSGVNVPGVRFIASYAPTTGDWVYVLIAGPLWIVLGKQP